MTKIDKALLIVLFSLSGFNTFAQEVLDINNYELDKSVKQKSIHAKITLTNGRKVKGRIKAIGDYSIHMAEITHKGLQRPNSIALNNEIHYTDIRKIKIRNIGASIGGFVVGTTLGVLAGGLVGFLSSCDDCEPEERLAKSAVFAGLGGIILGPYAAFDGPFIVHLTIEGQYNNYEGFKNEMERRRIKRERRK